MHKSIILHHHKSIRRKETEERLFHRLNTRQLRHNLNTLPLVFRQLIFNIERTDGVYFISEEVYTEWIFATVRIDIEDTTTNGKLTRFIDIIGLYEFEITQGMNHVCKRDLLPYLQSKDTIIKLLLTNYHFRKCCRIRNDINTARSRR